MAPFLLAAAAAGVLFSALAQGYANPEPCKGTSCGDGHDPALARLSDGTYVRFSTGGGGRIYNAPSLSGPWTYKCDMLPSGSRISSSGSKDLWAPDVSLVGSTYYVYYSVSDFGTQVSEIGLATSKTLECGTFTDHGSTGVSSVAGKSYNAIDPNLILVDGEYKLSFGSFWGDLFQVPMKTPPTAASGAAVALAFEPKTTHAEEGSFMILRNGYYYLFYSHGQCCGLDTSTPAAGDEYMIRVCRSLSATGPFIDEDSVSCQNGGGTIVLQSHGDVYAPGGQSVYLDPVEGSWVIIYHYFSRKKGVADADSLYSWNRLNWSNGWPSV
ncbi:hypothetical protein LTR08_003679 [Meristemomyces frigidus]|nr:hypothetical protein LTR08_003679 [Meristemomyces frigidus]